MAQHGFLLLLVIVLNHAHLHNLWSHYNHLVMHFTS